MITYIEEIKWENFARVISTRYGVVKNGGPVARATIKGKYEVEVIASKYEDGMFKAVAEFYATPHKNKSHMIIGEYETKKQAIKASESFIRSFNLSLLKETETDIMKSQEDPFIEFYKCYCGEFGKEPEYVELPVYVGCICKDFESGYRPRQSEAPFKMKWVNGKYSSVYQAVEDDDPSHDPNKQPEKSDNPIILYVIESLEALISGLKKM